jgi:hypothetical protein
MLPGLQYSAASIAAALALWLFCGVAPAEARALLSPWKKTAFETSRRWASLLRWSRAIQARRLWPMRSSAKDWREAAKQAIRMIASSSVASSLGPIQPAQIFAAAQDFASAQGGSR